MHASRAGYLLFAHALADVIDELIEIGDELLEGRSAGVACDSYVLA
jgi:hypothetical protein